MKTLIKSAYRLEDVYVPHVVRVPLIEKVSQGMENFSSRFDGTRVPRRKTRATNCTTHCSHKFQKTPLHPTLKSLLEFTSQLRSSSRVKTGEI